MKKLLIIFVSILSLGLANAQQEAQYTQFMVNPFLYNPALSGCEDFFDIKAGYRNQWTGIEGSPRTFYLSAHSPLNKHYSHHARGDKSDRRHSVGGLVGSDKAGDLMFNLSYLSYSYTITLSKGTYFGFNNHRRGVELALGTSVGLKQYRMDLSRIASNATVENVLLENNKTLPDASLGAWLYLGDYTFVGLSGQQLFRNRLTSSAESRLFWHYNCVAGSEYMISEDLKILPSIMIKKVAGAPLSLDINTRIDYDEKYFGGVSVRFGDAVNVLLGTLINDRYEIAYSYDYTTSALRSFSRGSHEIILGLRLYPSLDVRNAEDNW
jgi:type IX secretion system PorP/SprF family membrane protein